MLFQVSRAHLLLAIVLAAEAGVSVARADVSSSDRALAETLFTDAKKLMQAKKFAEACPKLAESQRLDPAPGTVLNLGLCHEGEGKLASAWVELKQAEALARADGRADRVKVCNDHIVAIEPKLGRVTIAVAPDAEVAGIEVKLDGGLVGKAGWGTASPVDAGVHGIVASAPGKKSWEFRFEVAPGASKQTVVIPKLADDATATPAKLEAARSVGAAPLLSPLSQDTGHDESHRLPPQRVGALIAGGVGIIGIAVGATFALSAKSTYDKANCDKTTNLCTADGLIARSDAKSKAGVATIAMGIGGAALVAGAVLWFTTRAPDSGSARGGSGGVFVSVDPGLDRERSVSISGVW